jgi:hypothetical protein
MITFTLQHGLSRSISGEASSDTTIGSLLSDANYRAILKHGENSDAVLNGVVLDQTKTLGELGSGLTIQIETRSNSKA